jgi:hypothetical protein
LYLYNQQAIEYFNNWHWYESPRLGITRLELQYAVNDI